MKTSRGDRKILKHVILNLGMCLIFILVIEMQLFVYVFRKSPCALASARVRAKLEDSPFRSVGLELGSRCEAKVFRGVH